MSEIKLKYGNDQVSYPFPEGSENFTIREPEFTIDKNRFCGSLQSVLPQDAKHYQNVGIVISDKTRLCGYDMYLPWLLDVLHDNGAKYNNIKFYIAYGTHPKQSEDECLASYGEAYKKYRFVHHDCNDYSAFTNLGTTSRGTSINIRKDVLESTLIITYGAISHHYFAGYGGGRKLLFPGLADKPSVYHNHRLFLDFENKRLSPGCQPGVLEGNPVAEDLKEIDGKLPEKISLHGILDSQGKVCKLMVGNSYDDFLAACDEHNSYYSSGIDDTFDMVIASAGGYPKDINYIQSHKSMHNASRFVNNGGTLILLAECRDGIGNDTFIPLFREGGWKRIFEKLQAKYEGNGGTAVATLAKTNRIDVQMVTSLPGSDCSLMGMKNIDHDKARHLIQSFNGRKAYISNASILVK